tara:strand:+ start:131 stop:607 length:477 start_codon:yes stop_codon:yes gene_type:complete
MVTVELLYRPNWNLDLFFKKFKVKRFSNGCLTDYVNTATDKKIKQKYPYFLQRSAKFLSSKLKSVITGEDNYSNEKKEIEEDIQNRMELLIDLNRLEYRTGNEYCKGDSLLTSTLSNSNHNNLENQVKKLSSQFKKNFDVRLMGEIQSIPNAYLEGYI